jgi:DUF4097 and DUF4098 domain-containing protein YvlB
VSKVKVLIVLCITVLFLAASLVFAGAEYREDFSKTLPLKAGDRFSLENVNGHVAIATWSQNTVEIKAVKISRRSEAELKEVEIRVDEGAGSVSVKAIWPKFPRRARVTVNFEIKVPEGVVLDEVETVNGSIELSGRCERINTGTTNGSVTVENSAGELSASTTNGDIRVTQFAGRVEADTTNGDIRIEGVTFKDGLSAETTNGSITLVFVSPETLNADLLARTTNGHITVDFPVTLKNLTQSKRRVEATIGQGGARIDLETTNGSIKLTK